MKNYFLLAVIMITTCLMPVKAQRHELGISLGEANVIGDIGRSDYIQLFPMNTSSVPISIGLLYRLNVNNRQSLRFNLIYNKIYFNDDYASEDYRYKRGVSDNNTIIEASAMFEYYFFNINDIKRSGSSPYIFGGVAAYTYEDRAYTINHELINNRTPITPEDFSTDVSYKKSTQFDFSIPFGVGYKIKMKYNWLLGFEVGARYTFQDNLDYSAIPTDKFTINKNSVLDDPIYDKEITKRNAEIIGKNQTGNTYKSNDWYMVFGINITYTFGRPPCYCY